VQHLEDGDGDGVGATANPGDTTSMVSASSLRWHTRNCMKWRPVAKMAVHKHPVFLAFLFLLLQLLTVIYMATKCQANKEEEK